MNLIHHEILKNNLPRPYLHISKKKNRDFQLQCPNSKTLQDAYSKEELMIKKLKTQTIQNPDKLD